MANQNHKPTHQQEDEQKNSFYVHPDLCRATIIGRVLNYIYRDRGIMLNETALHGFRAMHLVIEAFSNTLAEGERVRAFFISGARSCGVEIERGDVTSIPTNELYQHGYYAHRTYDFADEPLKKAA